MSKISYEFTLRLEGDSGLDAKWIDCCVDAIVTKDPSGPASTSSPTVAIQKTFIRGRDMYGKEGWIEHATLDNMLYNCRPLLEAIYRNWQERG